MVKRRFLVAGGAAALLLLSGLVAITRAQDPVEVPYTEVAQMPVSDPSCTFFGPDHDRIVAGSNAGLQARLTMMVRDRLAGSYRDAAVTGYATSAAASVMPSAPGGSRTDSLDHPTNTIDRYIFPALTAAGVTPAPPTTDWEFVRRSYLDLTGRTPTPAQIASFIGDPSPDKRSKLVDALVGSPQWLDKWTIWFSDLYQNNSNNAAGTRRYIQGVEAFNSYIRGSLSGRKPYNQMASELISTQGTDSYTQGEVNYLVGGVVTGGPQQDIFDQQIANTATTFLGLSNLNCLLCHDGRGHLDSINLWGYYTSRKQAWGMASFMSHTQTVSMAYNGNNNVRNYMLADNAAFKVDYTLGTTTGNRPPRTGTGRVAPTFILTGATPNSGENYRAALARMVTSDFQFARATVNYIWEYFFTVGIVSPSNQFDPLRLDPNNPPTAAMCPANAPCTLQPSNAALLNALAQDFVNSGYDIQSLMKEIVNSNAYQLSSRYNGTWDPSTANLFGRKLVRRLWSEELHDAITTSSGVLPTYTNTASGWGPLNYAMQLPEPVGTPDGNGGPVASFLDSFLRGNRDDQPRRADGSISQALGLMNDNFVMNRIAPNGVPVGLLKTVLAMPAAQDGVVGQGAAVGGLVDTLFMNVLSRHPTDTELSAALANLKNNRTLEAQYLHWSLYNKVDFTFNY